MGQESRFYKKKTMKSQIHMKKKVVKFSVSFKWERLTEENN